VLTATRLLHTLLLSCSVTSVKTALILCLLTASFWTKITHASVHRTENFLQRLSSDEGLTHNRAFKTLQDNNGYIWIATEIGLNRYDGYEVQHISGPNNVFSSEYISSLFLDNDGFLWVPTYSSGIFRMDPNTFETEHFQHRSDVEGSPIFTGISAFAHVAKNKVWLAGDNNVIQINTVTKRTRVIFSLDSDVGYVRTMLKIGDTLYIGTNVGLYQLDLQTQEQQKIDFLPEQANNRDENDIKVLHYEPRLGLIIGTIKGLYQIPAQHLRELNKPLREQNAKPLPTAKILHHSLNIWDLDKVGSRYYLATNQGLYMFDFASNQATFVLKFSNSRYYTNDNNILDVYVDSNQTFWMASSTQGVLRWSKNLKKFKHLTESTQPAISKEFVGPLYQDHDDHLWIGTYNGLNRYDMKTHTISQYLVSTDQNATWGNHFISGIFPYSKQTPDQQNKLWVTTDLGLFSFNKTTGELTPPPMTDSAREVMESQWIYNVYLHNNENIFVITKSGHFLFNATSGEIRALSGLNQQINVADSKAFLGFLPNFPEEIMVASSTHIYLYHLQTEALRVVYEINNYIPDLLFHIAPGKVDQDNILWFAIAGEGLIGLDAQTFALKHQFRDKTELPNNLLHSLEIDSFNNLWLGSANGLFRLGNSRQHVEHYVVDDGLISRELSRSSSLTLNNNQLAFGTQLGLTIFNPADFINPRTYQLSAPLPKMDYQVHLSEARILQENGETLKTLSFQNNTIQLDYDQPGLSLHYSTLDFQQQSRTVYQIDMQGPTEIQLSNYMSNELLLPRLEAGKHLLTIRAHHPIYGTDSPPLTVTIAVGHQPWKSPLAQTLYVVLVCIAGVILFLYRRNRARVFQQLHGKVTESLNRMQMALESNKSGIWEYHCEKDLLYSERIKDDLGFDNVHHATPMSSHINLINPEHLKQFAQSWQSFINSNQNDWQFTYQMMTTDGKCFWYFDVGKVVERDLLGKPIRISGTYTNITEHKDTEERSRVFGLAFSQINDWVLILDNELRPVTANNALTDMLNHDNQADRPLLRLLISRVGAKNACRYREIILSLKPHEHWQGEDYLDKGSLDKECLDKDHLDKQTFEPAPDTLDLDSANTPISVKIHAIGSESEKIGYYVVIISDISVQKSAEQKLRYMAHYDFLTDLPNRKLMLEKIRERIEWNRGQFAVLFIDLDKFKQVNDLYGHYVGDKLLRSVAQTLKDHVDCNDFVARQSGDEFIILLNNFETSNDIALIANGIIDTLTRPVIIDDLHVNVTASIGIALYPDDAHEADDIISKADLAMIHAKRQARGDYQFFTQDMNEEALARMTLENDLKRAVITNEFQNYYQPIVNSRTNTIVGAELLLRWNNAGKDISPGVFIPICEEIGIISQMTINAIDRALSDYKKWFSGHRDFYISINLSPVHILQEGLKETLLQLLEKHQLQASVLRLEITENTLLSDVEIALRRLDELRAQGFKLMLDDFGTGYSSMGYLNKFSIDYIKIDKSFVLNLENKTNRSIIHSVVTLANNLSLQCVVEGVETQEQREYMAGLGCNLQQGFYYSKAVPAPEIVNLNIFKQAVH